MIRTIIFDIGRVLIHFDFKHSYERMAPLCGYAPLDIPQRLSQCDLVARFESGQVEPQEFVRELSEILKMNVNYEQFCEIWSSIFAAETLIPESLVAALKGRYRLLVLSNTNAIHFKMMKSTYPIFRHFDDFVLSYEVGAMKPSPLIYQDALKKAGCPAEECFYTDDIAEYVEGAKKLGIDAVQFQNAGQIEMELKARGVSW